MILCILSEQGAVALSSGEEQEQDAESKRMNQAEQ